MVKETLKKSVPKWLQQLLTNQSNHVLLHPMSEGDWYRSFCA